MLFLADINSIYVVILISCCLCWGQLQMSRACIHKFKKCASAFSLQLNQEKIGKGKDGIGNIKELKYTCKRKIDWFTFWIIKLVYWLFMF